MTLPKAPPPTFRVTWQAADSVPDDRVYNCDFSDQKASINFAEAIAKHNGVLGIIVHRVDWAPNFTRIWSQE